MHALLAALLEGMDPTIPETWRSCCVWLGIVLALIAAMIWLWPS